MALDTTTIQLEDGLAVEVSYSVNEGQRGDFYHTENIDPFIDQFRVINVIEGDIDSLCMFVNNEGNFYDETMQTLIAERVLH